ncbi:unnamed protein product [Chrysoparadoxa australica]
MEARHRNELREAEGAGRRLVKQANKNKQKRAEAEAKALNMMYEVKGRHREEMEALEEAEEKGTAPSSTELGQGEGDTDTANAGGGEASSLAGALSGLGLEEEQAEKKRQKAIKKKEKARKKEKDREQRLEAARAAAGPTDRALEMAALTQQLAPLALAVKEVKSDGNCMYRAVAHQLKITGREPEYTEESYKTLRATAARHIRSNADEFSPFIDSKDGFDKYCRDVEETAEWGGQLELRAISESLEVAVEVYSASAPCLSMGEAYHQDDVAPLRLTFHERYYSLGAHYNSVSSVSISRSPYHRL